MPADISAERFVERLKAHRSPEELKKIQRYFKSGEGQLSVPTILLDKAM